MTNGQGSPVRNLVAGPALFALMHVIPAESLDPAARSAFGLLLWMAWWWITQPVHLAVTGFLPLVIAAVFQVVPVRSLLPAYASLLVILLLGANILATVWTRWGLDRRIALTSLLTLGANRNHQIVAWFCIAMALSTVLPNTVVAAAMMPIVVAMLAFIGITDLGSSRFGTALGLAVAWGTSVGGAATPLGGAPNLLTVGFLEESVTGGEFLFWTWVTRLLPLTLTVVAVALIFIRSAFRPEAADGAVGRSYFADELGKLGRMSVPERWGLVLFGTAIVLAFTRELYALWLPEFHPAFGFLTFGLLAFVIRYNGEPLLRWEYAQKHMIWGLLYLFAGGAALGSILVDSGAATWIATRLVPAASGGGFGAVVVFSLLTIVLTQTTSNTAAIAVTVPITITTFQSLGMNPVPFVYIVAVAGNCGLMLPSSSGGTAIAAGYGVNVQTMFGKGLILTGLLWLAVMIVGYLLATYWPGFGAA
jgi:sodium-dependent dicarboxylate transporter 2/3/5